MGNAQSIQSGAGKKLIEAAILSFFPSTEPIAAAAANQLVAASASPFFSFVIAGAAAGAGFSLMKEFVDHFKNLPEEDIHRPEMEERGIDMEELKRLVKAELGIDTNYFNFGVSGYAKAGKSTLINAFLGENKAATGAFETTHDITCYTPTHFPNVRLWDIPGSGTQSHGSQDYFMEKKLYVFDCLIILLHDTVIEEEIAFAKQALLNGQPVLLVRSRCDSTLRNMHDNEEIANFDQDAADAFVRDMTEKYGEELHKAGLQEDIKPLFISGVYLRKMTRNEQPALRFQEMEFLQQLKKASERSR